MRYVFPFISICAWSGVPRAEQSPETMTKLEVILQSPDVPAGSFAAEPKAMYRAGTRYCRIKEAADPEQGIHALAIINEPDDWMVNLLRKTPRHGVANPEGVQIEETKL